MRWFLVVLLLVVLLLIGGCLEYEVDVETVVTAEGKVQRTISIRELSEKDPQAWTRYAPAKAPYELSGNERDGFVAEATFDLGFYPSGLRVLMADIDDECGGADAIKDVPTAEGNVFVRVQDVVFGKVYRYEETVDLGVDRVRFRKESEFALDLAVRIEIAAMELLEPELDFRGVRKHARKVVVPQLRASLLAIHTELAWLSENGLTLDEGLMEMDLLQRDSRFQVINAELKKLGLRAEKEAKGNFVEVIFDRGWRIDESVWLGWLDALEGATRERKLALLERMRASAENEDKTNLQERAWEKTVPAEQREAIQKRLQKFGYSGIGALAINEFFDDHRIRLRVRLPGKVLLTNGALHDLPVIEWSVEPFQLIRPRAFAYSFLPSDKMVGRIGDARALLQFARIMERAAKHERAEIESFLAAARKDGLDNALAAFGKDNEPYELLSKVLAAR